MSADRAHAILSASGAERWMNCPPSARLEEHLPESASEYAEEGTLAHEVAELHLRKKFVPMSPRTFNSRLKKLKEKPLFQGEMVRHAESYVDYITEIAMRYDAVPFVAVEKRLDFSQIVPEGFGTGDCILISGQALHVIDYKYGRGVPVSAKDNPQLKCYGFGALMAYRMIYDIRHVHLHIFQPRLDNTSVDEIDRDVLLDWGMFTVKPIAKAAFAGEGAFNPGDWCRFCRAKAQCRARAGVATALEDFGGKAPELLTDEEIGRVLELAGQLTPWVKAVEDYALNASLNGGEIPGWKVVAGRSNRQFIDTDAAFEAAKTAGIDEALLYHRKPATLSEVEKTMGTKQFAEVLGPYVTKPTGKPTLVPADDARPAYSSAAADFDGQQINL